MVSQSFTGDKLVNQTRDEKAEQKVKRGIIYYFEKFLKKC